MSTWLVSPTFLRDSNIPRRRSCKTATFQSINLLSLEDKGAVSDASLRRFSTGPLGSSSMGGVPTDSVSVSCVDPDWLDDELKPSLLCDDNQNVSSSPLPLAMTVSLRALTQCCLFAAISRSAVVLEMCVRFRSPVLSMRDAVFMASPNN